VPDGLRLLKPNIKPAEYGGFRAGMGPVDKAFASSLYYSF
jgi:hypothetical protein